MTYADWKARENEQDYFDFCEQEWLRKALWVQNTERAGSGCAKTFGFVIGFAIVMLLAGIVGGMDMETERQRAEEPRKFIERSFNRNTTARLNTLGGREQ